MVTINRGSLAILLGLTASGGTAAWYATSPNSNDWAVCGNEAGQRIDDGNCRNNGYVGGGGHWVYLNRYRSAPAIGENISGGFSSPSGGVSYSSAPGEGIARGGFGSIGHGFGGFGHGFGG